ncbi:hypothetical protein NDU88_001953 [Pleurodeles waltl]|uniref:Uncharacterized protein n=1 Tax=Pleurodeles waltl TaxID=8319 RepID=A0AAV7V983_PLEWA|nr:hypothetical protein NDU88_001953 [Pleurodeles waltl]
MNRATRGRGSGPPLQAAHQQQSGELVALIAVAVGGTVRLMKFRHPGSSALLLGRHPPKRQASRLREAAALGSSESPFHTPPSSQGSRVSSARRKHPHHHSTFCDPLRPQGEALCPPQHPSPRLRPSRLAELSI